MSVLADRVTNQPQLSDRPEFPLDGRLRVAIEDVTPEIDCGRFPIKRVIGEAVQVEASVFGDGHDSVSSRLLYKPDAETEWNAVAMTPIGNDRWRAEFRVSSIGRYRYTVEGWIDHFKTWRADLAKRLAAAQNADQNFDLEYVIGA